MLIALLVPHLVLATNGTTGCASFGAFCSGMVAVQVVHPRRRVMIVYWLLSEGQSRSPARTIWRCLELLFFLRFFLVAEVVLAVGLGCFPRKCRVRGT